MVGTNDNKTSVIERKQNHKHWIVNTVYIRGFTCVLYFAISWIQCPHNGINNNNCVNFKYSRSQCVSLTEKVLRRNGTILKLVLLRHFAWKKANLRDLIAVTSLVILFKLYSNHWFFSPYDLEILWMTSKNNRAPHLGYILLCALFESHQWIQTGVTIL